MSSEEVVDTSIDEYEFFVSHAKPADLALARSSTVHVSGIYDAPVAMRRLLAATQAESHYELCVVHRSWAPDRDNLRSVCRFMDQGHCIQDFLEQSIAARTSHTWRVFPDHEFGKPESRVRQHLSDGDFQLALDYIHKAI